MNNPNKNIKLLKESIAHWQRMLEEPFTCGEKPYMQDCSLCEEYYLKVEREFDAGNSGSYYPISFPDFLQQKVISSPCNGCPIYKAGHDRCATEVYDKAERAWSKLMDNEFSENVSNYLEYFQNAAEDMIDFLKELLKKEQQEAANENQTTI